MGRHSLARPLALSTRRHCCSIRLKLVLVRPWESETVIGEESPECKLMGGDYCEPIATRCRQFVCSALFSSRNRHSQDERHAATRIYHCNTIRAYRPTVVESGVTESLHVQRRIKLTIVPIVSWHGPPRRQGPRSGCILTSALAYTVLRYSCQL